MLIFNNFKGYFSTETVIVLVEAILTAFFSDFLSFCLFSSSFKEELRVIFEWLLYSKIKIRKDFYWFKESFFKSVGGKGFH